jgi:integrase/recombinase XerC
MLTETKVNAPESWQSNFARWLRLGRGNLTVMGYISDLQLLNKWHIEKTGRDFEPALLDGELVQDYRDWSLRIKKIAPATWNRRRISLTSLAKWALEEGIITNDPLKFINRAKEMPQAPHWIDDAAFLKLMARVNEKIFTAKTDSGKRRAVRNAALISILVFAGLRESEAAALTRRDIQISSQRSTVVVRLGKGEKYRAIPLSKEACGYIEPWLQICGEKLFDLTGRGIQKLVNRVGEEAGIGRIHPHQLRHTAAKRMLNAGAEISVIQKILGHENISTTARYLTPSYEDMAEAVEKISQKPLPGTETWGGRS